MIIITVTSDHLTIHMNIHVCSPLLIFLIRFRSICSNKFGDNPHSAALVIEKPPPEPVPAPSFNRRSSQTDTSQYANVRENENVVKSAPAPAPAPAPATGANWVKFHQKSTTDATGTGK